MANFKAEIFKNEESHAKFSEPVSLDIKNWPNYNESLKIIQQHVNEALTALVELEKAPETCKRKLEESEDEASDSSST